jgi:hypothetical protein
MDEEALQVLIRTKLNDGRLPIENAPRLWGGSGRGETCGACERPITEDQLSIEGLAADSGTFLILHVRCFQVWSHERCCRTPS